MKKIFSVALVLAALLVSMSFVSCANSVKNGTYELTKVEYVGTGSIEINSANRSSFGGYGTLSVSGNNITFGGATCKKSEWETAGATFEQNGDEVTVNLNGTIKYIYTKQ